MKFQRRKSQRLSYRVSGVVTPLLFPEGVEENDERELRRSYTVTITNLSAGGVFLERHPPLPAGSFVRIDFDLEGAEFHCFGRVVREAETKESAGNGVRLIFVDDLDRTQLVKYLARQLEC